MTTFKDYLSLEQFTTHYKNVNSDNKDLNKKSETEFYQAVLKFLIDINKENPLKKISNDTGHVTNTQYDWNELIKDIREAQVVDPFNKKDTLNHLEAFFRKIWFFSTYQRKDDISEEKLQEEIVESYNKLITLMDNGNFDRVHFADDHYCFECGKRFQLKMDNWEPSFTERVLKSKGEFWYQDKYEQVLAEPCSVEKVVELNIEFKTGNLLAADWFRIEEFTKSVDNDKNYDVNCSLGRIEQSKFYAENYNFISTPSSGGTEVFEKNGNFMVGYHNEDFYYNYDDESEDGDDDIVIVDPFTQQWNKVGRVGSGLRAITIIEKEKLLEIIAHKTSPEQAKEILDKYIAANSYEVSQFKVNPGQYSIKFCGAYYNLNEHIDKEYKNESFEPYLLIENKATISKKLTM